MSAMHGLILGDIASPSYSLCPTVAAETPLAACNDQVSQNFCNKASLYPRLKVWVVMWLQPTKDGKAEAPAAAAAVSSGNGTDVEMKDAAASTSAAPEAGQYAGQLTGTNAQ